ncbi:uracil-DNA glycosylase family protein [Halorussus salinisoli]|uniref:uracil-DNA glycosylase family protein n=1 Tax=Halorussus salinisoli TaxID=2558242 RepID=UPI0010C1A2D0|nr:uracil-DNA glycosylase family protein [Halorussus salinisoli]
MGERETDIVQNAHRGEGPCEDCRAHENSRGTFVNPGLSNPEGELLFVTEEPRHPVEWNQHNDWAEYNAEWLPRFKAAQGGQFIEKLLESVELTLDDVWITDSIKCPTQEDTSRGIPATDTKDCFAHCRAYLDAEINARNPSGIVTLGRQATRRTLRVLGIPRSRAASVRVSREYGICEYDTPSPVVISLHWAQRTITEDEWVPVVQEAIANVLTENHSSGSIVGDRS